MKVFALALAFLATSALAAEVHVADLSHYEKLGSGSYFDFQRASGRAWVELQVDTGVPDSSWDYRRFRVPGLELVGNEVVLDGVVCGTLKKGGLFNYETVKSTKACKFVGRRETITVDNGFEVKTTKITRVYLVTE